MRGRLGKFLIGLGSTLITAGELVGDLRWKLHPAERSNDELDAELNGEGDPHVIGRIDLSR